MSSVGTFIPSTGCVLSSTRIFNNSMGCFKGSAEGEISCLVLQKLKKCGYNFKHMKGDKYLQKLSENKGWHAKQNMEAKLIFLDEWLEGKFLIK